MRHIDLSPVGSALIKIIQPRCVVVLVVGHAPGSKVQQVCYVCNIKLIHAAQCWVRYNVQELKYLLTSLTLGRVPPLTGTPLCLDAGERQSIAYPTPLRQGPAV